MLRDRPDIAGVFARLNSASGAVEEGDLGRAPSASLHRDSNHAVLDAVSAADIQTPSPAASSTLSDGVADSSPAAAAAHAALLPVSAFLQFLRDQQVRMCGCPLYSALSS